MEAIIDANEIDLELSEIEGDAILFYRKGKAPTAEELLSQIKSMYINFHAQLKKYDKHRICNCGACLTANNLTLKFVAHYGEVLEKQVKDHSKLFGKEVIVAHRLLKNQIPSNEYGLFSEKLLSANSSWTNLNDTAWGEVNQAEEAYDSGIVKYSFMTLTPLRNEVPDPVLEDYTIDGVTQKIFESDAVIEAPLDLVFNVISDYTVRKEFQAGLKNIDQINHQIAQNGSEHRCIIQGTGIKPTILSHDFSFAQNQITFVESDFKRNASVIWSLKAMEGQKTKIEISNFIKPSFIKKLMFKILIKKKFEKLSRASWIKLNDYCKILLAENKQHPNEIVLPDHVIQ